MTQKKAAKPKNQPIVLSGSVFLDGILAEDHPRARMPLTLKVGDIRLHNVNKPGSRPRFGETVNFVGFIVAGIWDGKKFRRLLLRKRAAVESTYQGPVARRERSMAILRYLSTLIRSEAVWFPTDSGYEVTGRVVPAPAPTPAPTPAAAAPQADSVRTAAAPAVPAAPAVNVSVTVNVAVTCPHAAKTAVKRRRNSRRKAADSNQLPLFEDLK